MKLTTQSKALLIRTLLFLSLFILASGIIGSWIIGTKLLFSFHFYIYGNLGKLVIFSTMLFVLLSRESLTKLKTYPFTVQNYIFLFASASALGAFYVVKQVLLTQNSFYSHIGMSLMGHFLVIAVPTFLLLGVFGLRFLKGFIKSYKKELLICAGLSLVLYAAIFQVWKLWPYLSTLVLQAQFLIFSQLFEPVYIIEPYGLFVKSFAVEIAEACSGLESIFLFTVLYIAIVIIDIKKLSLKRVFILFPLLMLALVVVNILRVFLLILIGVLINPQIMAALFHTYLGLILFVIFFFLFMKFGYPFLKNK